jgi:hypothetical protein
VQDEPSGSYAMEALTMAAKQAALAWRSLGGGWNPSKSCPSPPFDIDNQHIGIGLFNQRPEALRRQPDRRAAEQIKQRPE